MLNNVKLIEDLTHVLKKEKATTTFPRLLPSFMENVVSSYFVARLADSYTFNPSLFLGGRDGQPSPMDILSSGGQVSSLNRRATHLKLSWVDHESQADRKITERKKAHGLASPAPSHSRVTSPYPCRSPPGLDYDRDGSFLQKAICSLFRCHWGSNCISLCSIASAVPSFWLCLKVLVWPPVQLACGRHFKTKKKAQEQLANWLDDL